MPAAVGDRCDVTPSTYDGATPVGAGPTAGLRITLVNQFYPPDLAPTAHLTASLAEFLADRGHTVTVITGGADYVDAPRSRRRRRRSHRVTVQHLWTPNLGKGSVVKRLSDYLTFLLGATFRLLSMRRQDVVISLTTPPYVVVAALAHRRRHRRSRVLLWSMDCYPDVIEQLGSQRWLRRGGAISRALRAVNRWAFRRLDAVVALDPAMAELLATGYAADVDRPPMSIIPNWEPLDAFPSPSAGGEPVRIWPGYTDAGLAGRFVVLYLGNLGYGHPVEPVLDVAPVLASEDVAWLFMGGGARWHELPSEPAIVRRPYLAKEQTPEVMAGAGCALILLADEALGLMSPSKLHANLAAGLPILYVGPVGSNVDVAIARFGCGISLRAGDRDGLLHAVRRLRDDEPWRQSLSIAARRAFETAYCDQVTLPRWAELIETGRSDPLGDRS